MKRLLVAIALLVFNGLYFVSLSVAQNADPVSADAPASKDDVILYLRTMRSHDMLEKLMTVQAQSMEKMMHDQLNDKNALPTDFEVRMKKAINDLIKNMPMDDLVQAIIPAYQKHFTHGDIEAMNAFYSSPVGQKVLEELPAVTQEGMQAAMPILTNYIQQWQDRMKHDMEPGQKSAPKSGS
jgi:hypothetical protein